MNATLQELVTQHALSALDVRFAEAMLRLGHTEDARVGLACALVSRAVSAGHVCLDLAALCEQGGLIDAAGRLLPLALPDRSDWARLLRACPLVGSVDDARPLVLDAQDRLYLHRYASHQQRLAENVRERAKALTAQPAPTTWLDRLFPAREGTEQQRLAVETALRTRMTVITGGPGTGKTTTVVKLMAALVEQRRAQGLAAPRIVLVAPTGKAAARMSESIAAQKPQLPCDDATRAAISEQASTIHRALGRRSNSQTRFRHDADQPLMCDLLVVDEASMVDLPLMRRLLDATPLSAGVVLLGDADQLASVEAGAVLGDLCDAAARSEALRACVVELQHSHRYRGDSGIGRLAHAVRAGDAETALRVLRDERHQDINWHQAPQDASTGALRTLSRTGFAALQGATAGADALRALQQFRVLSAHREGPRGVSALNARIAQHLGIAAGGAPHYAWQPILITQNDHRLRLYNGDVGVIVPRADRSLVACFANGDGLREVSLSRLPPHDTVYAMSVHKSQGSEVDHVCIVLPEQPSRVLSRELLYTAITRARQRVDIVATEAVLVSTIRQRMTRASGLVDLLTDTAATPA